MEVTKLFVGLNGDGDEDGDGNGDENGDGNGAEV